MKQKIESYSINELYGVVKDLVILVEQEEDIFYEVKLSKKQFDDVVKIINKSKIGFLLDCYPESYSIEEIIDLSED